MLNKCLLKKWINELKCHLCISYWEPQKFLELLERSNYPLYNLFCYTQIGILTITWFKALHYKCMKFWHFFHLSTYCFKLPVGTIECLFIKPALCIMVNTKYALWNFVCSYLFSFFKTVAIPQLYNWEMLDPILSCKKKFHFSWY